jgi:hypothetical protein
MVVSIHPSVYLAGAGRAGRAGQEWWCLSVYLSCKAGAGQGSQTFSVTLRIMNFWPQSGFGNFEKFAIRIWEFREIRDQDLGISISSSSLVLRGFLTRSLRRRLLSQF